MAVRKEIASEADIRNALREWVSNKRKHGSAIALVEELGICQGKARIDLAVVDSHFEGFEIKSSRDSLRRLHHQVEQYSKVLDRATVVVGKRHVEAAKETVPEWWGILVVDDDRTPLRIKSIRTPKRNKSVDPRALVELLWYSEAMVLLEKISAARGVRGKPRRVVWDRVCEYFKTSEIAAVVRKQLQARKGIKAAATP